jgi:SGNH domain (fused to AT3 domains)
VLYLRDSPRPTWDIPICLSRAAHRKQDASVCTADRAVAVDPHVFDAERRAAADLRRIAMLDLSDLFCGPERCESVRDGLIVYRDRSHLTAAYVRRIAPQISERLAAAMPREELSRR